MVKSGLVEKTDGIHYRLASHLSLSLIILALTFWFILENFNVVKFVNKIDNKFLTLFFILIVIQIIFGAFLAGLNGGLLFNSWPDMNGNFFPDDSLYQDLYNSNSINNPSFVQFYHRLIGYFLVIFLVILNYFYYHLTIEPKSIIIFNIAVIFQIILGILTLLTGVKIYYASLHQLGSVFVLTSFIYIYYKNTN